MQSVPIVDSLTHPTISGEWGEKKLVATFENLVSQMKKNNVKSAFAVGIDGISNYSHSTFLEYCKNYSSLLPVAGVNPLKIKNIKKELRLLKKMGFYAIKVHPRYSNINYIDVCLQELLKYAYELEMVTFLCTYNHDNVYKMNNNTENLIKLLKIIPPSKIVLLHGGTVELLKYMELVRVNSNLLLDLSFTMLKYQGSSIDLDIEFLFQHFDRRISVGSDYPEFSISNLRNRFDAFSSKITREKKENIAYKNILTFCGVI